ncbi:hypothetical protein V7166_07145, partial [Bacillus thuringiensis]
RHIIAAMQKSLALAFSLCFTLHVAGKGTDRFYAWPDTLAHRKRMVLCRFFNLDLYIQHHPEDLPQYIIAWNKWKASITLK